MKKELRAALRSPEAALAYCQRLAAKKAPPPKRVAGPTRKEIREANRIKKRERTANVRVEVFKRDGGRCVICGDEATEMHHLVSGSGLRRIAEGVSTCVALCETHHREAHRNVLDTLLALLLWAQGNAGSYSIAATALEKRLAKIEEARRAS